MLGALLGSSKKKQKKSHDKKGNLDDRKSFNKRVRDQDNEEGANCERKSKKSKKSKRKKRHRKDNSGEIDSHNVFIKGEDSWEDPAKLVQLTEIVSNI